MNLSQQWIIDHPPPPSFLIPLITPPSIAIESVFSDPERKSIIDQWSVQRKTKGLRERIVYSIDRIDRMESIGRSNQ